MFYSSEEKFCPAIVVLIFFAEKFSAGAKILDRLPFLKILRKSLLPKKLSEED